MGTLGICLGPHDYTGPMLIYLRCVQHVVLMFKHSFLLEVRIYKYNKYMINFIHHLHFYSCDWLYR